MGYKSKTHRTTSIHTYIHTYIPVRLAGPAAAEPPRRWWTTPRSCIHPTVVVRPADLLAGTSARLCCCHHRGSARRPAPSPSLWPPVPPDRTRSPRWRCYLAFAPQNCFHPHQLLVCYVSMYNMLFNKKLIDKGINH